MATVALTTENFDEVTGKDGIVLVDFWASWCGPCVRLAPIYDELAAEMTHIRFVSVDVDAEPELAQQFGITSIPTLKFFRAGTLVDSHTGGLSKPQLRDKLEALALEPEPSAAPV